VLCHAARGRCCESAIDVLSLIPCCSLLPTMHCFTLRSLPSNAWLHCPPHCAAPHAALLPTAVWRTMCFTEATMGRCSQPCASACPTTHTSLSAVARCVLPAAGWALSASAPTAPAATVCIICRGLPDPGHSAWPLGAATVCIICCGLPDPGHSAWPLGAATVCIICCGLPDPAHRAWPLGAATVCIICCGLPDPAHRAWPSASCQQTAWALAAECMASESMPVPMPAWPSARCLLTQRKVPPDAAQGASWPSARCLLTQRKVPPDAAQGASWRSRCRVCCCCMPSARPRSWCLGSWGRQRHACVPCACRRTSALWCGTWPRWSSCTP